MIEHIYQQDDFVFRQISMLELKEKNKQLKTKEKNIVTPTCKTYSNEKAMCCDC